MALACNIDQRGRALRYRIGFMLLSLGVVIGAVLLQLAPGKVGWLIGGLLVTAGAFSLFEARNGWCVARAMGFKTRI
ncbi:MAG TPA: hypothetical protein VHB79_30600 [Polyangiaceae bacterium]|nr:hypothetical protein [Polyangiaceae bacterium]